MNFTFETAYNAKTMAVMARALRKTVRRKHSRRSRIFGWIVTVLALLLMVKNFAFDFRTVVTALAALAILITLLFEDQINGYVAKKRLLPGTDKATAEFTAEGYSSATEVGKSEWSYEKILMIAETAAFFVFIFSMSHAQLYDKRSLQGGTADEFRRFIEAATGKQVQPIT